MAVERDDMLDELNRPPRRIHAVTTNNTSNQHSGTRSGEDGAGRMGEPTVAEMLLVEMRDIKQLLANAMTEQAKMRVQVDNHEADLRDLKTWRDNLPEKKKQQQDQDQAAWWRTTNGRINIALAALIVVTTVAPFVAAHWH